MPASTPSPASTTAWSRTTWSRTTWTALLCVLALLTVLVHGFHPFAEDGGLYAAGIEYTLDPSLFPHFTGFVTEHLRFSLFAPALAAAARTTHLSVSATLLLCDLLAALGTLTAARALLRRCMRAESERLAGLCLLAAGWTLPIAGTSLFLMDPYVTARSISMPLSLLAVAYALDPWPTVSAGNGARHAGLRCLGCLLLGAVFHPLMTAYAVLLVACVRAASLRRQRVAWAALLCALLLGCSVLTWLAPPANAAERAAVVTRYYWFLSQWHGYEQLGLAAPFAMLGLVLRLQAGQRRNAYGNAQRRAAMGAMAAGLAALLCALFFAHESAAAHAVARLQPLRCFVLIYAVMLLLLGAALQSMCAKAAMQATGSWRAACLRALPALACVGMASGMFGAERLIFPESPHIELPWQAAASQNRWVQSFLWVRSNTPRDALFALDAKYVNTPGEDAQTFRAISLRSALPDYSKDGGEASITPALAPQWLAAAQAQAGLGQLDDAARDLRLQPFRVTWMVLPSDAGTAHPCPYRNDLVKICRLQP